MNRKKIIIVIVVFVLVALGVAGYFMWKNKQKDEEIPDVPEPIDPPPAGTSSWKEESFPLKKGMFGGQIKLLQAKLGLTADGKFGPGTEAAVKAKLGKAIVEKADYDKLFVSSTIKPGDHITSVNDNVWVYDKNRIPVNQIAKGTRLGIVATVDASRSMYGYKLSGKPDINYIAIQDAKKTYA